MPKRGEKVPFKPRAGRPLSEEDERFCHEYAKSLNATKAGVIAFGWSPSEATGAASQLLKREAIRERLAALLGTSTDALISEVVHIATSRITDIVEFSGDSLTIKSSKELSEGAKASLKKIKINKRTRVGKDGDTEESVSVEVELYDKLNALEKLARIYELYPNKISFDEIQAVQMLAAMGWLPAETMEVAGTKMDEIRAAVREAIDRGRNAQASEP